MDPYYRKIIGFATLIEKDWIQLGHPFAKRTQNINYILSNKQKDPTSEEISPTFIQFLDCVYQIQLQFPTSFEFNSELLIYLAYHYQSTKYGTFLFDSEIERKVRDASKKTISIWSDTFEKYKYKFLNPYYDDSKDRKFRVYPNFSLHKLKIWENYFFQHSETFLTNYELNKDLNSRMLSQRKEDNKKLKSLSHRAYNLKLVFQQMHKTDILTKNLKLKLSPRSLVAIEHAIKS